MRPFGVPWPIRSWWVGLAAALQDYVILASMNRPARPSLPAPALGLLQGPPHPCPYLPDRTARCEFTLVNRLSPAGHRRLMDAGFRRSGDVVYRPVCPSCRECVPIRVPVAAFRLSRSQRRVDRRNADVTVRIGRPECTDEKWRVYTAYLRDQHDGTMDDGREAFRAFLYDSPTSTIEMTYWIDGRFVAAGIVDDCRDALSSVYFYFDPAWARRSLGVFGALCEIRECRRRDKAFWYVGYYVRDCRRMNYKAQFQPCEFLGPDGVWRPTTPSDSAAHDPQ